MDHEAPAAVADHEQPTSTDVTDDI